METSCTVLDLLGISATSAYNVIGYVKKLQKLVKIIIQKEWVEFYLINAPFGFSTAFKLFKFWIPVSKIHILGYSYKKIETNPTSKFTSQIWWYVRCF